MGGAIGLAIVTSILNSSVGAGLLRFLTPEQVNTLFQTPSVLVDFSPETQDIVRRVFAQGYNTQFKILAGLAAAQLPASLIMWQKDQIRV